MTAASDSPPDAPPDAPRILTTATDVDWPRVTAVPLGTKLAGRLERVRQLAVRARAYDLVLLNGAVSFAQWYDEILVAGLLARMAPELCVVLEGCYWEEGTRVLQRDRRGRRIRPEGYDPPARAGQSFAHALVAWVRRPSVYYIVFGSDERRTFAARWSIPRERVVAMPYHAHRWAEDLPRDEIDGAFVFAGGDSLRDYRPLLQAAPDLAAPLVIATTLPMPPSPPNVRSGALEQGEFQAMAAQAAVHVVPMIPDPPRSSGQSSYLDALMLGIPVVVTEGPGVRDHLRDGHDGLIVAPGDPVALAVAVNRCLNDIELRRRVARDGRTRARAEFTHRAFRDREYAQLLSVWRRHRQCDTTSRS
jgi:hypothetical protein